MLDLVIETIRTVRQIRQYAPDPVPDELIRKILLAGQAAASGGNTQRWRFLVLKDPEIKKKVQVYYKKAFDEVVGPRYASGPMRRHFSRQFAFRCWLSLETMIRLRRRRECRRWRAPSPAQGSPWFQMPTRIW